MITTIREKAAPVRIGIDIGGTDTKIGLVDVHQKLIDSVCIATEASRPAEEVIRTIGEAAAALLEKNGIAMDQCVGAGIGVPGTVDRKKGIVRYSNNIRWEEIPLAQEIGKYLPIPVLIANDADCAALGEAVAGGGKDCSDVVMLTLGTGVGGGIILDGEIYEGRGIGGSELGHMVIVENGEPCTCGRRGCLEAYVSATALKRDARRAAGRDLDPEEIFSLADQGDSVMRAVVDAYIRRLGLGIVNIVNIFRPQLVLLGGGISRQGETLLAPLREIVRKECFGGEKGDVPAIETAVLGNNAGMIGAAGLL
nr:ROK family protein [Mediterraneibacter glycyrrhizinilyticus]